MKTLQIENDFLNSHCMVATRPKILFAHISDMLKGNRILYS